MKALTEKIEASEPNLNARAIGNALYGLKNMEASSEAVKDLLKALTKKIKSSKVNLNARAIGNASMG